MPPVSYNKPQRVATSVIEGCFAIFAGLLVTAVTGVLLMALVGYLLPDRFEWGNELFFMGLAIVLMLGSAWLGGFVTARMDRTWWTVIALGLILGGGFALVTIWGTEGPRYTFISSVAAGIALMPPFAFWPRWRRHRNELRARAEAEASLLGEP